MLPDSVLDELRQADGILFGAVGAAPGDKTMPSGILERGLILKIRFAFDHYVNLRPSRLFPGVPTPLAESVTAGKEVDFVVVREGTEGLYVGNGGVIRSGTPAEIATEVSVNTAYGVERVVRDAFARAERRPRKHLTLVHKTNVLTFSGRLWSRIVEEVSLEHPDVSVAYQHIDATTIHMVQGPGSAAPTAAVLSVALLLDPRGERDSARRIEAAVAFDLATRDHSATGHTRSIGDRLAALVSSHASSSA